MDQQAVGHDTAVWSEITAQCSDLQHALRIIEVMKLEAQQMAVENTILKEALLDKDDTIAAWKADALSAEKELADLENTVAHTCRHLLREVLSAPDVEDVFLAIPR